MTIGANRTIPIPSFSNDTCYTRIGISEGTSVHTWSLKAVLESFRQGGPRPIDEKKLDFEEAVVELSTGEGDRWAALDVGRQELKYGSGRLVSVREGPNVRQSFDGARVKSKVGTWQIDLWA